MSLHQVPAWAIEDATDEAHRWAYQRAARRAVEVGLMTARAGLESVTSYQGKRLTPRKLREQERAVCLAAQLAGVRAGRGPCGVTVRVWTADKRRRDGDNVLKAVMDGMQKDPEVLADDCMTVVPWQAVTWAGVDKNNPRVDVTVWMLDVEEDP